MVGSNWIRGSIISVVSISSLLFSAGNAYSEEAKEKTKPGDLKEASYPELGITTSGLSLGYWFGRFGVRLTQYYFHKDLNGIMFNIGYKFVDKRNLQHGPDLLAGRTVTSDPGADYDFAYAGLAYHVNWWGLFVQGGFARVLDDNLGNVKDEFLVPCGHIGYVYRFRPR